MPFQATVDIQDEDSTVDGAILRVRSIRDSMARLVEYPGASRQELVNWAIACLSEDAMVLLRCLETFGTHLAVCTPEECSGIVGSITAILSLYNIIADRLTCCCDIKLWRAVVDKQFQRLQVQFTTN